MKGVEQTAQISVGLRVLSYVLFTGLAGLEQSAQHLASSSPQSTSPSTLEMISPAESEPKSFDKSQLPFFYLSEWKIRFSTKQIFFSEKWPLSVESFDLLSKTEHPYLLPPQNVLIWIAVTVAVVWAPHERILLYGPGSSEGQHLP